MLQKQFNHAFATGDHERIAQEMSLLGSAPEPQIAILADDADSLLGATKGEWVGRSLAEAARGAVAALAGRAVAGHGGVV